MLVQLFRSHLEKYWFDEFIWNVPEIMDLMFVVSYVVDAGSLSHTDKRVSRHAAIWVRSNVEESVLSGTEQWRNGSGNW